MTVEAVVQQITNMTAPEQKEVVKHLNNSGLFDFDKILRRIVWVAVFVLLALALGGAIYLIAQSFGVVNTTVTGTGPDQVTSTTRPDMAAAWAAISAVIAGVVGLLVPSPKSGS